MAPVNVRTLIYLVFALALPHVAFAQSSPFENGQLQASYDFLMRGRAEGGVLFNFPNAAGNYLLPGSFYDTADYWGAYVCENKKATCGVNDTYTALNYQLSPPPDAAGRLQAERVNAHNSANIYDAATWQIAVMLGFVKNKFTLSSTINAYALASGINEVLQESGSQSACIAAMEAERVAANGKKLAYSQNQTDCNTAPGAKRAVTSEKTFVYNGSLIADRNHAYSFRALAPEWIATDPLMGSPYAAFVTASNLPAATPVYKAGKITWSDWKPITGENAWAFLIGPLQAAYVQYITFERQPFIPFKELAVQNALNVLPTFAAMQSDIGGVYYAPAGTVGNEGDGPINSHGVSVENNLSLYAGLRILHSTLRAELTGDSALVDGDKTKIKDALQLIDSMINGSKKTKGLLSFFQNAAWQNGGFVQGGLANDPGQIRDWVPTTEPMAVDVETWGIASLGATQIDQWFGYGAAFETWQRLKSWAGYGVGKSLWGVGYSNQDGNGIDPSGAYKQGVMSAEWTAGAITAVRNMIKSYSAEAPPSSHYDAAQKYLARLKQDESAMLDAMAKLRVDQYASTNFAGKPGDYAKLVPIKTKPYLYASRRFYIPFGWYANPLPSTASTAWVIMIADHYDPFGFGGVSN